MEKSRRDHLRAVIGRARATMQRGLEQQLARQGFFCDAPAIPFADLGLPAVDAPRHRALLDGVRREGRALGGGEVTIDAVRRFVREAGGTWVNRLAALRALEARDLLVPAAAFVSDEYGGISLRAARLRDLSAHQGQPMSSDEALHAGIADACRELSASVRVLFDLDDESSLLWPDNKALRDVLRSFSTEVAVEDWRQPDILGWVYQYYNTEANAELKKRKNKTTNFKYAPDDIPIANQFYTPHWVVRVLTDNTLGRLWLESRGRCPRLAEDGTGHRLEEARANVPHATRERPQFVSWIAEEPDATRDASVDRLCRYLVPLPSNIPSRGRKAARDLRVLDPACGSGHFLLYAFDVLFAIWREDQPELDPRLIPALILEHNLYGIDIDQRAAQLAAFSLYLKARATLAAIDPSAALEVRAIHIVVADAHLGDDPRKATFLDRYKREPEVQALFARILDGMTHTNVLGSLLKVRSELETLFGRVHEAKRALSHKARVAFARTGQQELIVTRDQRELAEVFAGASGRAWTIDELVRDLNVFEREVAPEKDVGTRLFLTDLTRAVGVLTMLAGRYDVVLMNPPYGEMAAPAKDYLKGNAKKKILAAYPRTHADLYAAFLEQGIDLLSANGMLGALVPWTYTYLSTLRGVRADILRIDARLELLQEYGYGILDGATVGTVGTIARRASESGAAADDTHTPMFHRLSDRKRDEEKHVRFVETLPAIAGGLLLPEVDAYVARMGSLAALPGSPYAYWASDSLRALFTRYPPLDRDQKGVLTPGRPNLKIADARQGLATGDDPQFIRWWWEIARIETGRGKKWISFAKGGKAVRFYARTDTVVRWENDGAEMKAYERRRLQQGYSGRGTSALGKWPWFYQQGIVWPMTSWRLRRFGSHPPDYLFGVKACIAFPASGENQLTLLGYLNSALANGLLLAIKPERDWPTGDVGGVPVMPRFPPDKIAPIVERLCGIELQVHEGDETCRDFSGPRLRHVFDRSQAVSIEALSEIWRARCAALARGRDALIAELDTVVADQYDISAHDRALIACELARRTTGAARPSTEDSEAGGEQTSGVEEEEDDDDEPSTDSDPYTTRDLVARWISHYVKQAIELDEDGLVPLRAAHHEPALIDRVHAQIVADIGEDAARALESQAPAYLGAPDLATWLETDFFPWHVQLYRNRPLFWLLTSECFERGTARVTFRAYVHAHKVSERTLPRLVSHYLDHVVDAAVAEEARTREPPPSLATRERRAVEKVGREWTATVAALKGFRDAVEGVIRGPARREVVPENAKWLARTIAEVRGGEDAGHGYWPDVDNGVRVNLTPLAEKKLLPRAVLSRLGG